jgi:hypothetical protein
MMPKQNLTVNIRPAVIARTKRFAKRNGQSVSQIVEQYLDGLTADEKREDAKPSPPSKS